MPKNPDGKFKRIKDEQITKLKNIISTEMLSEIIKIADDCQVPPSYVVELFTLFALDKFKKLSIHEYERVGQKLRKRYVGAVCRD